MSYGLTVRWSLAGAAPGVEERLDDYVTGTSRDRFTGRAGLHLKTWTLRPGVDFAGVYVWATPDARTEFVESLRSTPSPVDEIVGRGPERLEEYDVIAVAVGGEPLPR